MSIPENFKKSKYSSIDEAMDAELNKRMDKFRNRETINHPAHYGGDNVYETIKVIEAWGLVFHLGNAVKYISRSKIKGSELEDLKKARWYLNRLIELQEKNSDANEVG